LRIDSYRLQIKCEVMYNFLSVFQENPKNGTSRIQGSEMCP
jgi:hypothetical protein